VKLLREAGIDGWAANVEIRDGLGPIGIGDLVFRRARAVIEVDGLAFHVSPERFQRDRAARTAWSRRAGRCCGSPGGT